MKKLTLPRLASAVLGALFFLAACIVLAVRLVRGEAGLTDAAALVLTACGGAALTVLALRSRAPGLRRSLWVLLAAAVVFLVFYGLAQQTPSVPMSTVQQATHYVRGRVVEVTDNAYQGQQDYEDIPVGKQTVRVELRSGKYRGQVYELPNQLSYLYGTILKAGDAVTVAVTEEDGEISSMTLQDYDRTVPLALVVLAFLVVTVLVGRRVGAKSLLGLGLTVVCIFSILIPLLLGGWPTLPTILGMCAYVTVVEFVILGGVNRKTLCAILGTISGVAFAALFGELACALLRVNGYKMYSAEPTIEALLQIKQGQDPMHSLQLGDLLVGGIVIAALGAVNDVAMSISSAMNELVAVGIQRELGLLAFLVDADGGLALQRGRSKADEVVQQGGGAEAVHRAAAEHRRDGALTDAFLDALEQLFFGERLLHEELLHEGFVGLGDLLIQLGHVLFDLLFRLGGQSDLLAGDVVGLLGDEIDNADGLFAVQDREREGDDGGAEDIAQGVERIEEVRMLLVELRNIEHCGQTGVGQGFPALLGADGDAGLRGQADQAGIRNAQGLYDLRSKVKVAGVVQHVELAAAEFDGDDRRLDGVLSLLLFVIKVRNGRAVGALAETGDRFGHIKHALAQG